MDKKVVIHKQILFSHKKEGNPPFVTTLMNLEGIMLSEIKSEKDKYCIISLIRGTQNKNKKANS